MTPISDTLLAITLGAIFFAGLISGYIVVSEIIRREK